MALSLPPMGVIFAHGGFHTPSVFDAAKAALTAAGFSPVLAVQHPSINDANKTAMDDAAAIQAALDPYLSKGTEFLGISHSYGGTPLTIATSGYGAEERAEKGLKGGLRALMYVTSNMPAERGGSALGVLPPGLDIVDTNTPSKGLMSANVKAKAAFYGPDMPAAQADAIFAKLLPQSTEALAGPVDFALADLKVPAYYVFCEKDRTIALATQQKISQTIPTLKKTFTLPGGHSSFVTQQDLFVQQAVQIRKELGA